MFKKLLAITLVLFAITGCKSSTDGSKSGYGEGRNMEVTPGSQADLEVNVGDRVFFAFDRSDIDSEAQNTLMRQADWLRNYTDVNVVIEGHADERGTREYNLGLGDRRANAARQFLISCGISPSRIATISYGKERPAVMGSNEEAWAQNRRAVTIVAQ